MEAAAIENQNKLCVDAFQFSYFPIIWPSAILLVEIFFLAFEIF